MISTYILPPSGLTLSAGATANVDVRLNDQIDMKILLTQTWNNGTSSTTGVKVNLYPGFGGKDPLENPYDPVRKVVNGSTVPVFSNNFAPVTDAAGNNVIVNPPASQSTSQVTFTSFYLASILVIWPEWIRIQIINLDASKAVLIGMPVNF